jgi:hypothetical protein
MRLGRLGILCCGLLGVAGACTQSFTDKNPFLGYTEEYGVAGQTQTNTGGTAGGVAAESAFRRDSVVTFSNNQPSADVNFSFVAWVNVSSIRSADQQDALLRDGYSQLTREVRLGTAIVLPVGTFVFDGGGTAGATNFVIGHAQAATGQTAAAPAVQAITLNSPDALLVFVQPPVSCESVAFFFSRDGAPLTAVPVGDPSAPFGGATGTGGFKTLAQVDVYECDPLRPGLFFSQGGARQPNEYFEGEDVTFNFLETPTAAGSFCTVTIGQAAQAITATP